MEDFDKAIPPHREHENFGTDDVTMPGKRDRKPDGRFAVGDLIMGRYKVLAELGQGGMGVVYKCFDETAGVEIALKALPPELSHNSYEMEDVKENFQLVSLLVHQNIAIYKNLEKDNSNGNYYLIMEYCDGEDLRRWMRRKRREEGITLETVLPVIQQIAAALDYAHEMKIIHRDIKPGNIMIDHAGKIKVLDFGLAAQIHTSMTRVSMAYHGTSGTGPYMAPEQWRGRAQKASADQYALAVLTYEMLAGNLPFESADAAVLQQAVLTQEAEYISGISPSAQEAIKRAMSKEPAERFASCSDFAAALGGGKCIAPPVEAKPVETPPPLPKQPAEPVNNSQISLIAFFKKFFSGRVSRAEYWWFQLRLFLTIWFISACALFFTMKIAPVIIIITGIAILLLPRNIIMTTKRLHDVGIKGKNALLLFLPVIGWLLLLLPLLTKSQEGQNAYGAKPLKNSNKLNSPVFIGIFAAITIIFPWSRLLASLLLVHAGIITHVSIPYGVTEIGEGAFVNCDSLQSITIPNSVKKIEWIAFEGCRSLRSITIPGSIKTIGNGTFRNWDNLQSVTINDGVKEIGEDAFFSCRSLQSITIPGSVEKIGEHAFDDCDSLQSITIPGSVKKIGKDAFEGCDNLQSVTINNGVKEVGEEAFEDCDNLQSVTIPGSVEKIGYAAFEDCDNLQSVTINDGVKEIGEEAFEDCRNLQSVTIPGSVEKIGYAAFGFCYNLRSVTINDGVKEIGYCAFANCKRLQSVTIPGSVEKIARNAFTGAGCEAQVEQKYRHLFK